MLNNWFATFFALVIFPFNTAWSHNGEKHDNDDLIDHSVMHQVETSDDPKINSYLKEYNAAMIKMHKAVAPSGSDALDFLQNMTPHHQGAIDMSASFLKYQQGDEFVANIAKNIITDQKDEITVFLNLAEDLAKSGANKKSTKYEKAFDKAMQNMMLGMAKVKAGKKALGALFLEQMIPHHQGAIDMSIAYLEHGSNQKVKELASKILVQQEAEIKVFQQYLGHL